MKKKEVEEEEMEEWMRGKLKRESMKDGVWERGRKSVESTA